MFVIEGSSLLSGRSSSCREQGLLFVALPGLLIAVASFVVAHKLRGSQPSVFAARGLHGCSSQALSTGSVVVAHGLSCSIARGIFPDQGFVTRVYLGGKRLKLCFLHWQVDSLPLSHQGSPKPSRIIFYAFPLLT